MGRIEFKELCASKEDVDGKQAVGSPVDVALICRWPNGIKGNSDKQREGNYHT